MRCNFYLRTTSFDVWRKICLTSWHVSTNRAKYNSFNSNSFYTCVIRFFCCMVDHSDGFVSLLNQIEVFGVYDFLFINAIIHSYNSMNWSRASVWAAIEKQKHTSLFWYDPLKYVREKKEERVGMGVGSIKPENKIWTRKQIPINMHERNCFHWRSCSDVMWSTHKTSMATK